MFIHNHVYVDSSGVAEGKYWGESINKLNIDALLAETKRTPCRIGKNAFRDATIKKVVFDVSKVESGKTADLEIRIAKNAFKGASLPQVLDLRSFNIVSLGDGAFMDTTNVKTILFPKTLKYIGSNCFNGSSVVNLNLKDTQIKTLPNKAFANTPNLKVLHLPPYISSLFDNALDNTGLEDNESIKENFFFTTTIKGRE